MKTLKKKIHCSQKIKFWIQLSLIRIITKLYETNNAYKKISIPLIFNNKMGFHYSEVNKATDKFFLILNPIYTWAYMHGKRGHTRDSLTGIWQGRCVKPSTVGSAGIQGTTGWTVSLSVHPFISTSENEFSSSIPSPNPVSLCHTTLMPTQTGS